MKYYQVCIEAKVISCTEHMNPTSKEEAIEEALDSMRLDGYDIISHNATVEEHDEDE